MNYRRREMSGGNLPLMTNFLIKILIMLNYQRIGIQVGKLQSRILKNWLKRVKQHSKWFEPRSISSSCSVIVRVSVVLKRTVGDSD